MADKKNVTFIDIFTCRATQNVQPQNIRDFLPRETKKRGGYTLQLWPEYTVSSGAPVASLQAICLTVFGGVRKEGGGGRGPVPRAPRTGCRVLHGHPLLGFANNFTVYNREGWRKVKSQKKKKMTVDLTGTAVHSLRER